MNKKLKENIVIDTTAIAAKELLKPIDKLYKKEKKNRTYNKLLIIDILEYVTNKYKNYKSECSNIPYEVDRYNCYKKILQLKNNALKDSLKYCKHTSDEKVCKLRILQKIDKNNIRIMDYEQMIKDSQIEYLKTQNARELDPDEYYGNDYKMIGDN